MSEYVIAQKQDLINLANVIREKTETTDGMGLDEMAALVAAIEAGGGGDILGHKFAAGSFTLTEDVTSEYTILDANALFDAVKDDFPGATSLLSDVYIATTNSTTYMLNFIIAVCWIDNTHEFSVNVGTNHLLASFAHKYSLNSSNNALAYGDNYGSYNVRSGNNNGIKIGNTGLTIRFGASYAGFAGNKYNWIVLPVDHGEVRL